MFCCISLYILLFLTSDCNSTPGRLLSAYASESDETSSAESEWFLRKRLCLTIASCARGVADSDLRRCPWILTCPKWWSSHLWQTWAAKERWQTWNVQKCRNEWTWVPLSGYRQQEDLHASGIYYNISIYCILCNYVWRVNQCIVYRRLCNWSHWLVSRRFQAFLFISVHDAAGRKQLLPRLNRH